MNITLYKEYNGAICAGFKLDDNAPIELGFDYKDKTYLGWNNMPGWRGSNGIVYPGHINNKLELNPGFLQRTLEGELVTVQGYFDKKTQKIMPVRKSLKPIKFKINEWNKIALSENKRYRLWMNHLKKMIKEHECSFEINPDENIFIQWLKFNEEFDYQNKVLQLSKKFHRGIPYGRGPGICEKPHKEYKDPRNMIHWRDYSYEVQYNLLKSYVDKVSNKLNNISMNVSDELYDLYLDILKDDKYIDLKNFNKEIMHKALIHYIWFDFFTYGPGGYLSRLILTNKYNEDDLIDRLNEKSSENALREYIYHEMGDIVDSYYFSLDRCINHFIKKNDF